MSYPELLLLVEDVRTEVEERLEDRQAGLEGVGTVAELESMQRELVELEGWLIGKNLPPQDQRHLRAAYIVVDAWPADDRLGERICTVDYVLRHVLD
jgi:hypothetical protein